MNCHLKHCPQEVCQEIIVDRLISFKEILDSFLKCASALPQWMIVMVMLARSAKKFFGRLCNLNIFLTWENQPIQTKIKPLTQQRKTSIKQDLYGYEPYLQILNNFVLLEERMPVCVHARTGALCFTPGR